MKTKPTLLRSERIAACALLFAAVLGVLAANSPIKKTFFDISKYHVAIPLIDLDLSIGHWVSDGLLAVFFLVVAIEIKHEVTGGSLNSFSRAIQPAIAATGGVICPIILFFLITNGSGQSQGWPIPITTDIAFALGVLAIFGRGLPPFIRIFLLAATILDDLIAIVIIAIFFSDNVHFSYLFTGLLFVALFGYVSTLLYTKYQKLVLCALVLLGFASWVCIYKSGVHATIAGVLLGIAMTRKSGGHARHYLEPVTNGLVLPVFAFFAALVTLPSVSISDLSEPFWGILIALPVGKFIGLTGGGLLSSLVHKNQSKKKLFTADYLIMGAIGGIGFTVSLLMNELAYAQEPKIANEGTFAVLIASTLSAVIAAILVSRRAKYYRSRELDGHHSPH